MNHPEKRDVQPEGEQTGQAEPGGNSLGQGREEALIGLPIKGRYKVAEVSYNLRVEQLKQQGWIRRVEDIEDEWEQDDHFDDLKRIYQEVFLEMGLAWPPPSRG
jgi:hypothetical protein